MKVRYNAERDFFFNQERTKTQHSPGSPGTFGKKTPGTEKDTMTQWGGRKEQVKENKERKGGKGRMGRE